MRRLYHKIKSLLLYPQAVTIVTLQSELKRVQSWFQRTRVFFKKSYNNEPVLLLALFQKGVLRPDLARLIKQAKAEGYYVVCVNTLRLKEPYDQVGAADCYIEKPNFGRDFGSYKTGFLNIYRSGISKSCPRLLMINDSVYYSSRGLTKFLQEMRDADVDVLGATENYEIEHHLGSFCISMCNKVLNHRRIRSYWFNYLLTDVRPTVIKRGEMKLSKKLKRCVSAPNQFKALYNTSRFLIALQDDVELQNTIIRRARTSDLMGWKNFNPFLVTGYMAKYTPLTYDETKVELKSEIEFKSLHERELIHNFPTLKHYLRRHINDTTNDSTVLDSILLDALRSSATEVFQSGSQIHQNAPILLFMGLPIIKMDSIYRGALNILDMVNLTSLLNRSESDELSTLLLERPYGNDVLYGWKLSAFQRGLI